ncbi:MAG: PP2C family protein-serine/threonine phosphatase [Bacteroidota bacterium]
MNLRVEAICDKGCLRTNNEDHILLPGKIFTDASSEMEFEMNGGALFAVADGMGGHSAGEVASKMVLTSLNEFAENCSSAITFSAFEEELASWLTKIHTDLRAAGKENPAYKDMGTTLSGLFFGSNEIFVFNAGDSKTFFYTGKDLIQITRDHTLGETTGLQGLNAGLLVNCIGAISNPMIEVENVTEYKKPGNVFLICSDGLTDMLDTDRIKELMQEKNARALVEEAKRKGGRDNISVILIILLD